MLRYGLLGLNDLSSILIFSIPYSFLYPSSLQILIHNSIPIQYLFLKIIFSISHRTTYCPHVHWCEVIHGGTGKLLTVLAQKKMTIPLLATITYLLLCFKMLEYYADYLQVSNAFLCLCIQQSYYTQRKEFCNIPSYPLALSPFPSLLLVVFWMCWGTLTSIRPHPWLLFLALEIVIHLCIKHYPYLLLTLSFIFFGWKYSLQQVLFQILWFYFMFDPLRLIGAHC